MSLLVVVACGSRVASADGPYAGRIGVSIAGIEWLVARKARCDRYLVVVGRRIENAMQDPVANAELLETLAARRESHQRCIASVPLSIAEQQHVLDRQSGKFLDATGLDAATVDARLAQLHELEATHAEWQFEVRRLQSALERLKAAQPRDRIAIEQKKAVLASATTELDAAVVAVAAANRSLADLEAQQAIANRTGSATLNWATPTTRENGSPLATGELGGFEIYVLSEGTGESTVITISDPLATSYQVEGLSPDTYHFSIAAFDLEGKFSQLSDVVAKLIP